MIKEGAVRSVPQNAQGEVCIVLFAASEKGAHRRERSFADHSGQCGIGLLPVDASGRSGVGGAQAAVAQEQVLPAKWPYRLPDMLGRGDSVVGVAHDTSLPMGAIVMASWRTAGP